MEENKMKIKINLDEKVQGMACRNGQLRPGKGKTNRNSKTEK